MATTPHKPRFEVLAGGVPVFREYGENLSISLTDCAGFENDTCDFELVDEPAIAIPAKGTIFAVSLGYVDGPFEFMGTFALDEARFRGPPRTLTLTTRANYMKNDFKKVKDRDWHKKTVKQIVDTIAGETGLTPRVDPNIASKLIKHIDQANQSNMAFLTHLGNRFDAVAKVSEGFLYFGEKGRLKAMSGEAVAPVIIFENQAINWEGLIQSRADYDGVKARWTDLDEGIEKFEIEGEDKITKTLPHRYPTKEEAKDAAKGHYNDLGKETETFSVEIVGDPLIVAETPVILVGFRPGIQINWIVDRITHKIDGSGYTSSLELRLPDAKAKSKKVEGRE